MKARIMYQVILMILILFQNIAWAQTEEKNPVIKDTIEEILQPEKFIDLKAEVQNLFYYKNDSDLDHTFPYYSPSGQTVGVVATLFKPQITFNINRNFRLYYEAELGLNFWSKNNPDQISALSEDIFILKHREIWSEGNLAGNSIGFKVGYQYFRDPTGLFIAHWIGAGNLWVKWGDIKFIISAGQMPDSTYEGITTDENNFTHDIGLFGWRLDFPIASKFNIAFGAFAVLDDHVVDKTNYIVTPCVHAEADMDNFNLQVDGAFQTGKWTHSAIGGKDQIHLSWAGQIHLSYDRNPLGLHFNILGLSPDDSADMNTRNYSFYYSGKNKSSTLIFTEDEIRDKYDNLDEKMAGKYGSFFLSRAGLLLSDVKLSYKMNKYIEPSIIAGGAFVLNKENVLGSHFAGIESDVDLKISYNDFLDFHLTGGTLIPGSASSALVNQIDLKRKNTMFMGEASLSVKY